MPELPEVETVGRALAPYILQKKILDVEVLCARLRTPLDSVQMKSFFIGEEIQGWKRRGKYLIFQLVSGKRFILHLGMTGTCRICDVNLPRNKHEHIIWTLSNQLSWRFSDIRKFGQVWLIQVGEDLPTGLQQLGIEALDDAFDAFYLWKHTCENHRNIKSVLLDQHIVAGLGNIYVNEALWMAKISPQRLASTIGKRQLKELTKAIKEVLLNSIECGGTTISDFKRPDGSEGKFVLNLHVYGKEGELCSRCQTPIQRCVIQGRSSWFCPTCQKK